jgi:hypothetical protein
MSGVLDRMVQRSRGQLPAIEPLVRTQQTAAAALPFTDEESAAPTSRRRNDALAGQERALREESAGRLRDDVRLNAAQTKDATRRDSRRSEALEVSRGKEAAEIDETPARKDALKGVRLDRAVELPEAAQESDEQRESSIEMRVAKMPAKPAETAGESVPAKAKVEKRAETQGVSPLRKEAGDAAAAMDAAEHTEIHITIGSVELRAPRVVPAPPKAPAFRPRVTLDEFLKRGSGSGGWGAKS